MSSKRPASGLGAIVSISGDDDAIWLGWPTFWAKSVGAQLIYNQLVAGYLPVPLKNLDFRSYAAAAAQASS